jgi:hypothetical protein
MANLALPTLDRVHRLPKWKLFAALSLIVLALMALSFVLGRETMGGAGTATPVDHTVLQPYGLTHGGFECHEHEQC